MIKIIKKDSDLLLEYTTDSPTSIDWIDVKLQNEGEVTLCRTFTFTKDDLISSHYSEEYGEIETTFQLGKLENGYYIINSKILDIKFNLKLHHKMEITHKTFIAERKISIFSKIDSLIKEEIIIGGKDKHAIPVEEFSNLLKQFPTSTELTHYANARITRILKDYLGTISDAQQRLDDFLERKKRKFLQHETQDRKCSKTINKTLIQFEQKKFEYIRDELRIMLGDAESYSEQEWQRKIASFILIIFPKYIKVLENLQINDFYSNTSTTRRYVDIALLDSNGNIDIIEIKKPFSSCILSQRTYRDNYIPKKELSGAIMQAEKYIFHLSKWGRQGEITILDSIKSDLPPDFRISITNPKGVIILGRDNDFDHQQRLDFEIIRRQYTNMLDIITYDDLLRRLDSVVKLCLPTKICI